eukprot:Rmarinus@m.21897
MRKSINNANDELEELQKKYQLLEGERKAQYKTTQFMLRSNRETVSAAKREYKELRRQLDQLQKERTEFTRTQDSESLHMTRVQGDCFRFRKEFDELRSKVVEKVNELEMSQDTLRDLERLSVRPTSEDSPLTRQIRTLENRLDKAMIKFNEAMSIKKTYEQIVKRLKEERIGFDNQLAAIEKTLKAKEQDLEELKLMSNDATHAKEVAKQELMQVETDIAEQRKLRERELQERRAQVQQKVEMNKRMENREKLRREMLLDAHGDMGEEGEKSLKRSNATNAMHSQMNERNVEEEMEKITAYEEAFRRIKEATGVSDVNEAISKFLTQADTKENLEQLTKDAQGRIDELQEEKGSLKHQAEEIKYAGSGGVGSRRVVDEYEGQLSDANAKLDRNKNKYWRVARLLIDVKAGIEHLSDKLDHIKIDSPPIAISDETVVEVMAQCEQKIAKLLESVNIDIHAMPQVDLSLDKQMSRTSIRQEPSMDENLPMHNTRIRLNESDEEDDFGLPGEVDDEGDEEVQDRYEMKKFSYLMLEKQTKPRKKRGVKKAARAEGGKKGKGARSMGGKAGQDYDF